MENDPTEKLNPSRNPELVKIASFLNMDYLDCAICFLSNNNAVNAWAIKRVMGALIIKAGYVKS